VGLGVDQAGVYVDPTGFGSQRVERRTVPG
jgi:hypothetical protein